MDITFTDPTYLWLFISVPFLIFLHFVLGKKSMQKALNFANFEAIEKVMHKRFILKNVLIMILRTIIVSALVLSIAGTTVIYRGESTESDMILALDVSGSMLAKDYDPNRLEAEKELAKSIVDHAGPDTKIALVAFTGAPYVESYLIKDKEKIKQLINKLDIKPSKGTSLGNAIFTATNLLFLSNKPGVIYIISDGQNNVGIELDNAINYTKEKGITIYALGMGTEAGYISEKEEPTLTLNKENLAFFANSTKGVYKEYLPNDDPDAITDTLVSIKERNIVLSLKTPLLIFAISLLIIELIIGNIKFRVIAG